MPENKYTCHLCGKKFNDKKDGDFAEGNWVCEECLSENYNQCDICGEWVSGNDITMISDEAVCQKCLDNNYDQCEDCGEWVKSDYIDRVEGGDRLVCENCRDNYMECRCGYVFHKDDSYYSDSLEEWFCSGECRENAEDEEIPYRDETKEKFRDLKSKRLVGVEIEAEDGNKNLDLPKEIGIAEDGSLTNGIELKIPASNGKSLANFVKSATKELKNCGWTISENCGLHVHLEFPADNKKIKRLFVSWLACQDVFYSLIPAERRENNYCKKFDYDFDNAKKVKAKMIDLLYYKEFGGDPRDIDRAKSEHYQSSRYYGLNLHSIFFRGTAEFRIHSGTMNAKKILYWIGLLNAFVDMAMSPDYDKKINRIHKAKSKKEKLLAFFKQAKVKNNLRAFYIQRFNKFN